LKLVPILRYFNYIEALMPRQFWIFSVVLFLIFSGTIRAQSAGSIRTVVIDAGHGGHDPGALGKHAREKNINLSIALKLGRLMQSTPKAVRVIYTRETDSFVTLYDRADIANNAKADLFISIHCNANKNNALRGAETYIMGLHKSEANLNIAKLENSAILLETDYKSTYDGFDPNSDESYIIFSLNQNSNLDKSTRFAAAIQEQMEERVGMNNRGVRQAGFLVLYKTTMPSVLVESGYLSNADEEKFLLSEKGQDYIAAAIFRAFCETAGMVPVAEHAEKPVPVIQVDKGDEKLSYRVQITAEAREIPTSAPKFAKFSNVTMYRHGGMYKYTVGNEADLPSAHRLLAEVIAKGVKDAFIVIFRGGERIPQTEADKLLRK
jgi:N-acetylmuramoyl-L-alanine amidase